MVPSDVVVRAELPRSPNGKFDRNLLRQELRGMSDATVDRVRPADGDSARRRHPARAARRARRQHAVLRLRPRAARPSGSSYLRATLPAGIELSYAVKANPMPAVVQHLSGLVDGSTSPPRGEMRVALDTPMPADRVSFAGPGKTPPSCARRSRPA